MDTMPNNSIGTSPVTYPSTHPSWSSKRKGGIIEKRDGLLKQCVCGVSQQIIVLKSMLACGYFLDCNAKCQNLWFSNKLPTQSYWIAINWHQKERKITTSLRKIKLLIYWYQHLWLQTNTRACFSFKSNQQWQLVTLTAKKVFVYFHSFLISQFGQIVQRKLWSSNHHIGVWVMKEWQAKWLNKCCWLIISLITLNNNLPPLQWTLCPINLAQ